jgi:hypothetical protein
VQPGIFVGVHKGIACGPLEAGAVTEHLARVRIPYTGVYEVVAMLYDTELSVGGWGLGSDGAVGSDDAEQIVSTGSTPSTGEGSGGTGNAKAVVDTSAPSTASADMPSPSPQAVQSVSGTVDRGTAAQVHGDVQDAPGASLRSLDISKGGLRRVGVMRKKKLDDGRGPSSARVPAIVASAVARGTPLLPADEDWRAEEALLRRGSAPIAVIALGVHAMNDARWSWHAMQPSLNMDATVAHRVGDGRRASAQMTDAHHGPDTIVH